MSMRYCLLFCQLLIQCRVFAGTKKLFKMMLGTDSEFVNKFFQARKYWDINIGQWTAVGAFYDNKHSHSA